MESIIIYHNPRCSKSRETLRLLEASGHQVEIIDYLMTPPDVEEVLQLIDRLGIEPIDLVRTGEKEYQDSGICGYEKDAQVVAEGIAAYPRLLQRPVVCVGNRAGICRPPELVSDLMEASAR